MVPRHNVPIFYREGFRDKKIQGLALFASAPEGGNIREDVLDGKNSLNNTHGIKSIMPASILLIINSS